MTVAELIAKLQECNQELQVHIEILQKRGGGTEHSAHIVCDVVDMTTTVSVGREKPVVFISNIEPDKEPD